MHVLYLRMYVCMYVCMSVCMYVCKYVCPCERGYEWSIQWPGLRGVEEGAEPELSNRRGEGDGASDTSLRFPKQVLQAWLIELSIELLQKSGQLKVWWL